MKTPSPKENMTVPYTLLINKFYFEACSPPPLSLPLSPSLSLCPKPLLLSFSFLPVLFLSPYRSVSLLRSFFRPLLLSLSLPLFLTFSAPLSPSPLSALASSETGLFFVSTS